MALVKKPPVPAPWPPAEPNKEEIRILAGWTLESVAAAKGLSLADLLKFNFGIDMAAQKDWPFHVNWYLRETLKCSRKTPRGNYVFSGGEIIYAPLAKAAKKSAYAAMSKDEIIDWFKTQMIPQRTAAAGGSFNRIWKTPQRVFGGGADPNGICGAVADYVWDKQPANLDSLRVGFILWHVGPFTHIGNIIMPKSGVKVFKRNDVEKVIDITPAKYGNREIFDWHALMGWTVIDLYFKEVTTVYDWWRDKSYAGWGELVIDPDGQFINGVTD